MFSEFLKLVVEFGIGVLGYLGLEASKYFFAGDFVIVSFFKSNIKPLLWSVLGGIIVAAVATFTPQYLSFISRQINGELTLDWQGLLLAGGVMGGAIKGLIEKNKKSSLIGTRPSDR